MKKILILTVSALSVVVLTACSSTENETKTSTSVSSTKSSQSSSSSVSNDSSSSQTSVSSSSPSSSSSTEQSSSTQTEDMNLEQIANGDFSSIVGTWKSNDGAILEITSTTISLNDHQLQLYIDKDSARDGLLSVAAGGFSLTFLPKGISLTYPKTSTQYGIKDLSDQSKERIMAGGGDGSNACYKIK